MDSSDGMDVTRMDERLARMARTPAQTDKAPAQTDETPAPTRESLNEFKSIITDYITEHTPTAVLDKIDKGLKTRGLSASKARMSVIRCLATELLQEPDWSVDMNTHMGWERSARRIQCAHPQVSCEEAIRMAANGHQLTEMPTEDTLDYWAEVCQVLDLDA